MEILQTILPVVIVLAIGVILRRRHLLDRSGINALKSIVVNITLPAVLLSAFASTSYSPKDIIIPICMFAICLAAWALGRTAKRILHLNSRFVPFLTTGFEAGMLGYALFTMLYGSSRTAEFAIIDLGQVLFVFTVYKILLDRDSKEKTDGRKLLKEMLLSPIIIAIIIGVLIGATGLYHVLEPSGVSRIFDACTDFVSAPTSMIILLTIGYDLVFADIPWKDTLRAVAVRLVIMIVLGAAFIGVLKLLWPETDLTAAVIVMFLLPPPFVLPVFADDADQRTYVSSVLSICTLVSILGFVLLAVIG
ncbi:MAG: hypothetical protein IKG67_07965 [Parasporobacterium sp.]|nr:hypothetical protein [Parasporobacterium sp.]